MRTQRPRPLADAGHLIGLVAMVAPFLGFGAIVAFREHAAYAVEARARQAMAIPCAPTTYDIRRSPKPRTFDLAGARFTRLHGNVFCARQSAGGLFAERPMVCTFSRPLLLEVETGQETRAFETGVGEAMTVAVSKGRVRCVRGPWFRG